MALKAKAIPDNRSARSVSRGRGGDQAIISETTKNRSLKNAIRVETHSKNMLQKSITC